MFLGRRYVRTVARDFSFHVVKFSNFSCWEQHGAGTPLLIKVLYFLKDEMPLVNTDENEKSLFDIIFVIMHPIYKRNGSSFDFLKFCIIVMKTSYFSSYKKIFETNRYEN